MPIVFQYRIYRADLRANPDVCYVFGDNDRRVGLGGQAGEMRGEPNAIGVRTKKAPGMDTSDFYADAELSENCAKISADLDRVEELLLAGKIVVLPLDGIGTGLSALDKVAPMTLGYVEQQLAQLKLTAPTW